jgi:hypothetical protein
MHVYQKRRSASDLAAYAGGMQFSSALSSIQKSTNAGEGDRLGYVSLHFAAHRYIRCTTLPSCLYVR